MTAAGLCSHASSPEWQTSRPGTRSIPLVRGQPCRQRSQLIAVGSRGRGARRSVAMGSAAAELVRLAVCCQVMIVPLKKARPRGTGYGRRCCFAADAIVLAGALDCRFSRKAQATTSAPARSPAGESGSSHGGRQLLSLCMERSSWLQGLFVLCRQVRAARGFSRLARVTQARPESFVRAAIVGAGRRGGERRCRPRALLAQQA
jgi:hypothetical protein